MERRSDADRRLTG